MWSQLRAWPVALYPAQMGNQVPPGGLSLLWGWSEMHIPRAGVWSEAGGLCWISAPGGQLGWPVVSWRCWAGWEVGEPSRWWEGSS